MSSERDYTYTDQILFFSDGIGTLNPILGICCGFLGLHAAGKQFPMLMQLLESRIAEAGQLGIVLNLQPKPARLFSTMEILRKFQVHKFWDPNQGIRMAAFMKESL